MPYMIGEVVSTGLMILTTIVLLAATVRLLVHANKSMTAVYFAFTMVSILLSEFYWLAYDILRGDVRMPFAANEFAEAAFFLLLASSLRTVFRERFPVFDRAILLTALYAVGNIVLWILWNGDWIEALLTGPAYLYFLVMAMFALRQSEAIRRSGQIVLGCAAFASLALMYLAHFIPSVSAAMDLVNYILLFGVLGAMVLGFVRALRTSRETRILLALAYCAVVWAQNSLYMSTGWWYAAMEMLYAMTMPAMFFAVRREVIA
ncbi:MAG: hypothetical protein IKF65_07250 [Clostridia bacterium]|nr:hypothetical protein [Clostridia bacterium]